MGKCHHGLLPSRRYPSIYQGLSDWYHRDNIKGPLGWSSENHRGISINQHFRRGKLNFVICIIGEVENSIFFSGKWFDRPDFYWETLWGGISLGIETVCGIVNHNKFQVILINKKCYDFTNIDLNVDNQTTKSISFVEFLGINLHDKWNFDLHIATAKQLILKFLNFCLVSNINYCLLVSMFWVLNIWKNIVMCRNVH